MSSPARNTAVAGAAVAAVLLLAMALLLGVPVIALGGQTPDGGLGGLGGLGVLCGPGGTAQTVADQQLDAEQLANAVTIIAVVQQRQLPARAAVIAVATAYQESTLHNIAQAVDHDSLGLFQQRISYYTAAVAADPVNASNAFLDRLAAQPNWPTRPLTNVAADIQRPLQAYRGRYAQWEPLATQLVAQLWQNAPTGATTPSVTSTALPAKPASAALRTVVASAAGTVCPGSGGDAGTAGSAAPTPGLGGLTLTGSIAGNGAVTFALAQLGKPYLWGGNGPGAWDCSGLTMAAWASVGVALPRVTGTQAAAGTPVPIQDARSGDLVLIPGSDGTAANPGHVGMVAGVTGVTAGEVWLVEAPRTGLTVRLTLLSGWAGQIVTVRRIR